MDFTQRKTMHTRIGATLGLSLLASTVHADPILWIHDAFGNLGTVDVADGAVSVVGDMGVVMTDIAFDPAGTLYGMSFTALYTIDLDTAAPTLVGSHGISGGNALVFGSDGTLYGAGGSLSLFEIDPSSGASTNLGSTGYSSAGDLAFNGGNFYLASTSNQLVQIDLDNNAAGTAVGPFGYGSVFGLATAENGVLYGVSGTTVFSVDTATGGGTAVIDYAGQGLYASYGSSFYAEARPPVIPIPAAAWLFGTGLLGLLGAARRNTRFP